MADQSNESPTAAEQLQELQTRFDRAVEGSHDGFWEWNIETDEDFISERWANMLGYELSELSTKRDKFTDIIHPDDADLLEQNYRDHVEHGKPYSFIIRVRHKDGHYVHVQTRGKVFRDETGKPIWMSGSHTDVSEQIENQIKLKDSEERFRNYANAAADRFWELDENFRFTYVSDNRRGNLQFSPKNMIGKQRWELPGVNEDEPNWHIHRSDLEAHRSIRDFVYKRTHADGTSVWIKVLGDPVYNEGGEFKGYRGTNSDITAEVEANLAREFSEKKFRALFEMAGDAIMVSDATNRRFVEVSQTAAEQRGYTVEEMLNLSSADINAQDSDASRNWYQLIRDQGHAAYESLHRRKDGSTFPVEINARLITIGDDQYIETIARDITERKHIEMLKDEFVAVASHELRTPLTAIMGAVGLVKSGVTGELPEKSKDLMEVAYSNCERLSLLVNDLLDMTKLETGAMEFDQALVDVQSLVDESISANAAFALQFETEFVVTGSGTKAQVLGDRHRLSQVMANLMSNAAKFSPQHRPVEISVQDRGPEVRISVTDYGTGIPVEFRDKLFDKFSQADTTDSRTKMGTGLGLSITRAIVERHNGTVGFETQLEQGTTFFVDLPVHSAAG